MIPTSNHNYCRQKLGQVRVVYLLIPTSNHNLNSYSFAHIWLYIFWFLHQTTTPTTYSLKFYSCISFDSYIKPQRNQNKVKQIKVVYLLIPTSNHNWRTLLVIIFSLYIFWFLHQTTTECKDSVYFTRCISFDSYIKPQQGVYFSKVTKSCISFDSYIKPQLDKACGRYILVVYLLIPTSNHNEYFDKYNKEFVVYLLIPTSNHNL